MVRRKNKVVDARYIVIPDTHGILVDRPALECVLRAIEIIKPTGVIHLGDIGEWESVCHHRWKRIRQPDPQEVSANIKHDATMTAKYVLNPLDESCDKANVKIKEMLTGNHDRWLDYFVQSNPDYAHIIGFESVGYRFEQIFDWKKRGWRVHPCGKLLKIGELNFYHGHLYGGIHHARNHLMKMGVNIVYGHWHDFQAVHITHADGPKGAYSLGCLKQADPNANEWLEHRPVNWAHMFGIVDFYHGGYFAVHPVPIIFGRTTLLGTNEIIDGNKPRPLVSVKRMKNR